jgi:phosphoribosyl-ATP pyrophosphohydrolase
VDKKILKLDERKKKPMADKKKKDTKPELNILDKINADDGLAILKKLAEEDASLLKRVEDAALEYFKEVVVEDIADEVFWELDSLEVEDVWDQSGTTRYGYVDSGEKAWEMFEDAIEPYLQELKKCQDLKLDEEAKKYCMGILKGIYKFEKESENEFKEWAIDAPGEIFEKVFNKWKKNCTNLNDIKEMKKFVNKNFPDWKIQEY